MAFHFTCPHCFKKTLVDDRLAGQRGPCVGCGKQVVIPPAPSAAPNSLSPVGSTYVRPQDVVPEFAYLAWVLRGIGLIAIVSILAVLTIYIFWPTFQGVNQRRLKMASLSNLQVIARALESYAAEYGTYPPPIVYDKAGKPMHSWRVLILDYLGEGSLQASYNMNEPWDSLHNAMLLSRCPRIFIDPTSGPQTNESCYFLITGKGTVFPPEGPLSPSEITDGRDRTILVIEAANTIHEWTKPIDIDYSKINYRIGAAGPNAMGGNHEGGACAVFADGQPAWLPGDLDPILIDAIISPASGEPIDPVDYQLN